MRVLLCADWENTIHFENFLLQLEKKTYFLALGTIPVTGVGFIMRKIAVYPCHKLWQKVMVLN